MSLSLLFVLACLYLSSLSPFQSYNLSDCILFSIHFKILFYLRSSSLSPFRPVLSESVSTHYHFVHFVVLVCLHLYSLGLFCPGLTSSFSVLFVLVWIDLSSLSPFQSHGLLPPILSQSLSFSWSTSKYHFQSNLSWSAWTCPLSFNFQVKVCFHMSSLSRFRCPGLPPRILAQSISLSWTASHHVSTSVLCLSPFLLRVVV